MIPIGDVLLGPEKLPAVPVLGMKDDIYSLSSFLRANAHAEARRKLAIYTEWSSSPWIIIMSRPHTSSYP